MKSKTLLKGWGLTLSIILTLALIVGCAAPAPSPTSTSTPTAKPTTAPAVTQKYEFRLGHIWASEHAMGLAAQKFADLVSSRSNGQIKITIFPLNQLGSSGELIKAVPAGTVDIGMLGFVSAHGPEFGLSWFPYLVSTWEEAEKVYYDPNAWIPQALAKAAEKLGSKYLAYNADGFRGFSNKKRPVRTPADIKGLMVRVPQGEQYKLLFEAFGAATTFVDGAELYTALQVGTVDAQDNGPQGTYTWKYYEVQPYYTTTRHMAGILPTHMNLKLWNSLPSNVQNIIQTSATESAIYQRQEEKAAYNKYLDLLRQAKIQVIELTPAESEAFKKVGQSMWPQLEKVIGRDLLDRVLKEYGK